AAGLGGFESPGDYATFKFQPTSRHDPIGARHFTFYEAFGLAAVLYLILVYGFIFMARRVERRLSLHLQPSTAPRTALAQGLTR
ncbi:hypothetical protein ACROSR_19450, partial [Roseovarius tibetensis]